MKRTKLVLSAVAMTAAMIVFAAPAMALEIEQEVEQEAESGDVDQSFEVFGGGDNSNQSVGVAGCHQHRQCPECTKAHPVRLRG